MRPGSGPSSKVRGGMKKRLGTYLTVIEKSVSGAIFFKKMYGGMNIGIRVEGANYS